MKYAWHCAYCGEAAFFTDHIPVLGELVNRDSWVDAQGNKPTGETADCPRCKKGLIPSSAFIKAAQSQPPVAALNLAMGDLQPSPTSAVPSAPDPTSPHSDDAARYSPSDVLPQG